jgi:hypothetical protein
MSRSYETCQGPIGGLYLPSNAWEALCRENIGTLDQLLASVGWLELYEGIESQTAQVIRLELPVSLPPKGIHLTRGSLVRGVRNSENCLYGTGIRPGAAPRGSAGASRQAACRRMPCRGVRLRMEDLTRVTVRKTRGRSR